MKEMMMVRVYIMEGEKQLQPILKYLHDTAKVRGATVFRAISGFGQSGELHSSSLVDLSFNLPITIEFFDSLERAADIVNYLNTVVEPGHVVCWPVSTNLT